MGNYLKGIGDAALRINEILPSLDARINRFTVGHTSGIIQGDFEEFGAQAIDRGVIIKGGFMQAHGYFACADTETQINFIIPSGTNYVQLYAEIDLSVLPNKFEVKATAMSNSTSWAPRQDSLRANASGKFQLHLWQATLTASGVTLTDRRAFIAKPSDAVTAENYTASGGISTKFTGVDATAATKAPINSPNLTGTPTAPTAEQTIDNTQVATTRYVRQAISDVKNITQASFSCAGGTATVYRQVNFVYGFCNVTCQPVSGVIGTIPVGFRPKQSKAAGAFHGQQISNGNLGTGNGVYLEIGTDGAITVKYKVGDSWGGPMAGSGSPFVMTFGYEIA
jgi:hypothetical protein